MVGESVVFDAGAGRRSGPTHYYACKCPDKSNVFADEFIVKFLLFSSPKTIDFESDEDREFTSVGIVEMIAGV